MKMKNQQAQQLYQHMRHPMMIGPLIVFWVTPLMTYDRACFAISFTLYQLFGNRISEHDIEYVENQLVERFQNLRDANPKRD